MGGERAGATDGTDALFERDDERGRLEELLRGAAVSAGGLLVVEGPAGIGKTAVLQVARRLATARGFEVMAARAGELDRDVPFALARQLFEPLLHGRPGLREELMTGAARQAAAPLALDDGGGAGAEEFTAVNGLFWLTVEVAERRPLLIACDDAHEADGSSLRWLRYLARRIDDLPVALLLAGRVGEEGRQLLPFKANTDSRVAGLSPFSEPGCAQLLRTLLGCEPDAGFTRACHVATGGNPLLLRALAAEIGERGIAPDAAAAGLVGELHSPRLADWVALRLESLPAAAGLMAEAVALMRDRAQPRHLARLAKLEPPKAAEALDALTGVGLVRLGPPVEFVHPLIRRAVYDRIPAARRAQEHARAARLLGEEGAELSDVAAQLLGAERAGDPWAVDTLRAAADVALGRGAPEAAVPLLRRALEEPAPPEQRPALLCRLGQSELRAREPAGIEHLRAALESDGPGAVRGEAALLLATVMHMLNDIPGAVAVAREGLAALGQEDRELRLQLSACVYVYACADLTVYDARAEFEHADLESLPGETAAERLVLAPLATDAWFRGATEAHVISLARRALAHPGAEPTTAALTSVFTSAATALCHTGRAEEGIAWFDATIARAQDRGWRTLWSVASSLRAVALLRRGELPGAEADARAAVESSRTAFFPGAGTVASAVLADILVETGDLDGAGAVLDDEGRTGGRLEALFLRASHARLLLAQGRYGEARSVALGVGEALLGARCPNALAIPWRCLAARASIALGDPDGALRLADEELVMARAGGWALGTGTALRVRGHAAGGEDGLAGLEEAVAILGASPFRLDHAHALVEFGAALRRANRRADARSPLREGLELAHRCGAGALGEHARRELSATGARPRKMVFTGLDALTASERRVAEMAAQGLTNRAIAQTLFVSMKTVQKHLGNTYMKLNVDSRDRLADALAAPDVHAGPRPGSGRSGGAAGPRGPNAPR